MWENLQKELFMAFDVKKRKRELIKENIDSVPVANHGRKIAKFSLFAIVLLRFFLFVFEIIYFAQVEAKTSVWSHLLLLPFLLILYMIYDGNKSFVYIPMLSAPIRLVYHFTSVLPSLAVEGISALTVISLIVFIAQFFVSIVLSAATSCDVYFSAMQKVNLKLRSEMINGRR